MRVAILTIDNREHSRDYSCPAPYFGTAPEALLQGFAELPDVEVHVVSCLRQPVLSPEKLAKNIWYHSLLVPKTGWMTTGYQGCIRAVRKELRKIQPDIVHGQGTERDCAMEAIFSGYPNVLTIHGNMAKIHHSFPGPTRRVRLFQTMASRLEDYALSKTAGVFCNSAYTESLVSPRAKHIWRVPNALRSPCFSPATGGDEYKGLHRPIVNIGILSPYKRQLELLKLAEELHNEGWTVPFVFVGARGGSGRYNDDFEAALAKAEALGYAYHAGVKKTDELIEFLDAAGAMVHFPTEESFGLVVAEALARNLKFFGSALGGILDIAPGVDGAEIYGVDDWAGLKRGIKGWLEAGRPRPTQASAVMETRYHPRSIALRHLEIYREVLNSSR